MTIRIDHFNSSCSFSFAFDEDGEDPSFLDWSSCTANFSVIHSCPVRLNISSDFDPDSAYLITPLNDRSCLLADIEMGSCCIFNPYTPAEYIAEDILDVVQDEELSSLCAKVIKLVCFPALSTEYI